MKLQVRQNKNCELSSKNEKNSGTLEENQDSSSCSEHLEAPKHLKTKNKNLPATQLVTSAKLCTRKAHTACKKWNFSSNSKSKWCLQGYTLKAGEKFNAHFVETLKNENWSLHFDGNRIKLQF